MDKIYNTCIHFTGTDFILVRAFVELSKMEYSFRELKSDKKRPYSLTVYGTREQMDEFHEFLNELKGSK